MLNLAYTTIAPGKLVRRRAVRCGGADPTGVGAKAWCLEQRCSQENSSGLGDDSRTLCGTAIGISNGDIIGASADVLDGRRLSAIAPKIGIGSNSPRCKGRDSTGIIGIASQVCCLRGNIEEIRLEYGDGSTTGAAV